jgi:hypothetical protein
MPDIDRTADIKVNADREMVTAEIPLAGHASEHWRELFGKLAAQRHAKVSRGGRGAGGPYLGHRLAVSHPPGLPCRADAGCCKCSDQPGQ